MNKRIYIILIILAVLILIGSGIIFGINAYVKISSKDRIMEIDNVKEDNYDAILVLGAGLWDGKPSPILKDRLKVAIDLYKKGIAKKIIMSGDHRSDDYDEVNVMKEYAINEGVLSSDIFMDHLGISTYDSVYRAKEIFLASKIIIVTQEFHLYRSLYLADKMGIDAIGVSATLRNYSGALGFEVREILARDKDFFKAMIKAKSKYLGDIVPVNGNGDITNDK